MNNNNRAFSKYIINLLHLPRRSYSTYVYKLYKYKWPKDIHSVFNLTAPARRTDVHFYVPTVILVHIYKGT